MQLTAQQAILAFFASLATSALLTPFFRAVAIRFGIVDHPNQSHKSHSKPVPYLGGLAIITTIGLGVLSALVISPEMIGDANLLIYFFSTPLILALIGLIDDLKNISSLLRFLTQTAGAIFVASVFLRLNLYGQPSEIAIINVAVTVFWIVGITNSINFIDNLDGGAAGIVVISSLSLAVAALVGEQYAIASISFLISGATMGFLFWNFNPARIYLGDSGALFLGAILSVLIIRFDPPTATQWAAWVLGVSLVAIPILDTTVAVTSRIWRGVSPFLGGKDHLSHRLIASGMTRRTSALAIWWLQAYFSFLGVLLLFASKEETIFVCTLIGLSWVFSLFKFLSMRILSSISKADS